MRAVAVSVLALAALVCVTNAMEETRTEPDVLVGGVSEPVKKHGDDAVLAANKALEKINAKPEMLGSLNAEGPVSLGKIVEVRTQVVAGINYYLTLELQHKGEPFQADMVVWARPWLENSNSAEEPYQVSKLERKPQPSQ